MESLRLVSFDPFRTFDLAGVTMVKPEQWIERAPVIRSADWVLFPHYWQVNALVYGWKKRIFPSISSYHLGHDKIEMTRAFQAMFPEHVPYTRILPNTENSIGLILEEFSFPFVAKRPRASMGDGVHLIESMADLDAYIRKNDALYVQEHLPVDRDLRVVWVGDRIVSAYWRQAPPGGFHHNVARGGRISFDAIPDPALDLVTRVATDLAIDHAGFDVAVIDDHGYLIEMNVLFGNQALNAAGLKLGPIIHDYLSRASRS